MVQSEGSDLETLLDFYRSTIDECVKMVLNSSSETMDLLRKEVTTLTNLAELSHAILQEDMEQVSKGHVTRSQVWEKWHHSRFSVESMDRHREFVRESVERVGGFVECAKTEGIVVLLGEKESVEQDKLLVSFTLNEGSYKSPHLTEDWECLDNEDFTQQIKPLKEFRTKDELNKLAHMFDLFVDYHNENKSNKAVQYILSRGSKSQDCSLAYISTFTNGIEDLFELPGKPDKPEYVEGSRTPTSLKVELTPAREGLRNVSGFQVMVFEVGVLIRTTDVERDGDEMSTELFVDDLKTGMEYSFKVHSVSMIGRSPKSNMSNKTRAKLNSYRASLTLQISNEGEH